MVRTVISLEEEEKAWLDRRAEQEKVSMTELVRRAVRQYRQQRELEARSVHRLLEETSGIWTGEDGLSYQRRIRGEWHDR